MQVISLSGSPRGNVGKKHAKDFRTEGMIPCVVYGGEQQILFNASEKEINKIIFSPNVYIVELMLDGKKIQALIKDAQFHPVTDRVLHIDFIELVPGKAVKATLPLRITGNAVGMSRGGTRIVHFRKLRVMAKPENLTDAIVCDISKLDIGDALRIKDLVTSDIRLLEEPNAVVVAIAASRASRKAAEEAAEKDKKKK